jgi:hypothetical protein
MVHDHIKMVNLTEKIVSLGAGDVTIIRPSAKVRNDSLIKASEDGKEPNKVRFIVECLPHCIKSHPFGMIPLRQALDSLDFEEYDLLSGALSEVMNPLKKGDLKK